MKINVKYIVMSILLGLASQWVFSFVKLGEFTTEGVPLQFVEYKDTICCLTRSLTRHYRGRKYAPDSLEFYERSSESEYKLKHTLRVKTSIRSIQVIDGKLYAILDKPSWSDVQPYLGSQEESDFESYQEYPFPQEADRDFFRDIFLVGLKGCIIKDFVCFDNVFYLNPEEGPLKRIIFKGDVVETPTFSDFKELDDDSDRISRRIFSYHGDLLIFGYQSIDETKERIKYFLNFYEPKSLNPIKISPALKEFSVDRKLYSQRDFYPDEMEVFLDGDRLYFLHSRDYNRNRRWIRVNLLTGTRELISNLSGKKDCDSLRNADGDWEICKGIAYVHAPDEKRLTFMIDELNVQFDWSERHLQGDVAVLENHILLYSNEEYKETKVAVYSLPPSLNNITRKIRRRDEFLEPILRACYSSSKDEGKKDIASELQDAKKRLEDLDSRLKDLKSRLMAKKLMSPDLRKRDEFLEPILQESSSSSKGKDKKEIAPELLAALTASNASKETALLSYNNPDGEPCGLFAKLPLEVLLYCCENLDLVSISRLQQTSKSMNKLLEADGFKELKKQYLGEKVRWSWLALDSNNHEQLVRELCVAIKKQDPIALWIGRELLAKQDAAAKQTEKKQ